MKAWKVRDAAKEKRNTDEKGLPRFALDSLTNIPGGERIAVGGFYWKPHAEIVQQALTMLRRVARIHHSGLVSPADAARMRNEARAAFKKIEDQKKLYRD